jgi:hypothetical protein
LFERFNTVIASEAKQSIGAAKEVWIASSLTLLAMTTERKKIRRRKSPADHCFRA